MTILTDNELLLQRMGRSRLGFNPEPLAARR
jgi:hypothetical protein